MEVKFLFEYFCAFFDLKRRVFLEPKRINGGKCSRIRIEEDLCLKEGSSFAEEQQLTDAWSH